MQSLNLTIVRRLMDDVWGRGMIDIIPDLVANDYVGHLSIGDHYGPEGVRIDVASYRAAIADLTVTVDDLFAIEDRVVRRYTLRGIRRRPSPATENLRASIVLHAIAIDTLANGRLLESWVQGDPLPP